MEIKRNDIEDSSAPLIEHLVELRFRLIRSVLIFIACFFLCFFFSKNIFNFLLRPYEQSLFWANIPSEKGQLIYTAPQEFFLTQVKVAIFGGIFLSFPFLAREVYQFIAPGLYQKERDTFLPFLFAAPIFFLIGASLVYFVFTPFILWFFLAMQQSGLDGETKILFLPKVSEYLNLILTLIFSFGLIFQIPVVMTLMAQMRMISSTFLKENRKWAIVLSFILAGIVTPPDPISQIALSLPLLLLYELSLWSVIRIEEKHKKDSL